MPLGKKHVPTVQDRIKHAPALLRFTYQTEGWHRLCFLCKHKKVKSNGIRLLPIAGNPKLAVCSSCDREIRRKKISKRRS